RRAQLGGGRPLYGVRLILILAVIGGIIAYLGDRIGMRVGRRRLTLFGLRPKHTSGLITILTGILIVAVSLAVPSLAAGDVRTARMQYEGVAAALMLRLGELEPPRAQRDAARRELLAAEERLERITAEYEAAVRELREADETLAFTLPRGGNLQLIV